MSSMYDKLTSLNWWLGRSAAELLQEPPQMAVTAIVPAYNEAASIAATIESLLAQTYPLSAIIVIDDCSTDNTGDIARRYEGVTVLRTPLNQGTKSQAQNYGLEMITSELFVTVDGDTVLRPDALYEAMRFFNDLSCEVVCGTVIPQTRRNFWERGRLVEYLHAQAIMKPAQNHHGLVLVASGCFSIFRTETVRQFGGFNERTLAEDMDLTWEIHDQGGRVYFAPKAVCYPVDPPTGVIYARQLDRWYRGFMQNLKVRNFRLFPNKRVMGGMVYLYLVWFGVSAIWLPIFLLAATSEIGYALGYLILINALFVLLPALVAAWRYGVVVDTLMGFFPFMFLQYFNLYLYLRAVVRELVLGQKLNTWQKGH